MAGLHWAVISPQLAVRQGTQTPASLASPLALQSDPAPQQLTSYTALMNIILGWLCPVEAVLASFLEFVTDSLVLF